MEFQVNTNNVTLLKINQVESGEYNVTECKFIFSNEYEGLTKIAVFTGANGDAYKITILNNKCEIPSELLTESQIVQIGVYAYDVQGTEFILRYSPMPTRFMIEKGSYVVNAVNMSRPTPTEVEQLQSQITHNANNIEELQQNVSENTTAIESLQNDVDDIQTEQTEQNTKIQKNTDDIVDVNQSIGAINADIGEINQDINNLETNKADKSQLSVYSLITETGSQIELNINTTNYKMKSILKDKNGNTIFTSNEIDLPLESFVVSATYDNTTKEIVLTLQNGQTIRFSVADLVSGLVSEDDLQTILANYYTKTETDTLLDGKVDKVQGKGLSTEDFTTAEKTKLAGIEAEANKTIVDNELDNTSENPVQNKVIYEALSEKQTEINNLQQDVEDLRNASYKVPGTGTDIILNNTAKGRLLKNDLSGRTEQEQLSGKNLFDKNNYNIIVEKVGFDISHLQIGSVYTFSSNLPVTWFKISNNNGGYNSVVKQKNDGFYVFTFTMERDSHIPAGATQYLFINVPNGTQVIEDYVAYNFQIEEGSTATSYEPYCGGIPSPNPDFQQPIKNVTGNANEKIQNLVNYLDWNKFIDYSNWENALSSSYKSYEIAGLKNNTTYTLCRTDNSGYDENMYAAFNISNNNSNMFIHKTDETRNLQYINTTTDNTGKLYIVALVYNSSQFQDFLNIVKDCWVIEGENFEQKQEQNYPFTFSEGQRAMQGTQLLDAGIHQKRKQKIFDGTEDWYQYGSNIALRSWDNKETPTHTDGSLQGYKCNIAIETTGASQEKSDYTFSTYNSNNIDFIVFHINMSVADWKAYLAEQYANGTPVIVEYELAESELENNIIPYNETQQAQYNAIKQARSYDDITYITSTSDELGFNMNVVAVADANKIIDSELQEIKSAVIALGGDLNV